MGTHGFCLTWKTERKAVYVVDVIVFFFFFGSLSACCRGMFFVYQFVKVSLPADAVMCYLHLTVSVSLSLSFSLENVTVLQLANSISLPLNALSL